jgi:hypothetical protein
MQHKALATAVAAVAAAGVVVTTGVLSGAGPGDRQTERPEGGAAASTAGSGTAAREWPREIPEGLRLDAGLPETGGDFRRNRDAVTAQFCDTEVLSTGAEVAAERAGATGPEYADQRDLRVFVDDAAAARFVAEAAAVVRECPEEQLDLTTWVHDTTLTGLGEESVRFVRTYEVGGTPAPGATWWEVVRVGNAVLLGSASGEYLPGETLAPAVAEQEEQLRRVVADLCVFSAAGC